MRRVYRSNVDKIIGGVCGGIAQYFNIDPVLVRIIWAVAAICFGCGLLAYILCWICIPANPDPAR